MTTMAPEDQLDEVDQIEGSPLDGFDIGVIVVYFSFIIAFGLWASYRSKTDSVNGFFLASKNMHWIPVGASIFSSNVGSGHFVGLAGAGASTGIAAAGFELSAIFCLMLLGFLFVPVYMSSGVYTLPEYLRERFGGQRIRIFMAIMSLLLSIFTKISVELYAGAIFIQQSANKHSTEWLYFSILFILAITALVTIAGGLTAVFWTDLVQTIIMVIGATILMGISFHKVGGYNALIEAYPYALAKLRAGNGTCGHPREDFLNLMRTNEPGKADLPWPGMTFGVMILVTWYYCGEQVMVQRALAAKNITHAKAGCILASWIKILPLFLLSFPGMAARVLFPDRVACSDPIECTKICGNPVGCSNIAYAELVTKLLPSGLTGLMLAVMMAAIVTSLTSVFNSVSTIFTIDIWTRFRKNPSDRELILVGRVSVIGLVIISILWIPVIEASSNAQLFEYINTIIAFLAAPVIACFCLAIFWPRITEQGAFWGMMVGLFVGLVRFILHFLYLPPLCGSEDVQNRPKIIVMLVDNVNYMNFLIIAFVISLVAMIAVSLVTEPIPVECTYRLTFWTRHDQRIRRDFNHGSSTETTGTNDALIHSLEIEEKECSTKRDVPLKNQLCRSCCPSSSKESRKAIEDNNLSEAEKAKLATLCIQEQPKMKLTLEWNAILVVTVTIFIYGYYA